MSGATGNVLALLELLQARPSWTGAELAARLAVDGRTVRRYVRTLHELGIPVVGERGRTGGYRLLPGHRLPPLALGDGEAAAVLLGLVSAHRLGLGDPRSAEAALAKLRRVLPERLRAPLEALEQSLQLTLAPADAPPAALPHVLALAAAVHRRRRVSVPYAREGEAPAERDLSPFGLVVHAGRWYLSAHDHDRGALRTFRVDRLGAPAVTGAGSPAPDGHDPLDHVARSLARVPWRWAVEVHVDLPVAAARARLPAVLAELDEEAGGTRVRMRVDSLDWMASLLAGLQADFVVREPVALRDAVRRLAERLRRLSGPT